MYNFIFKYNEYIKNIFESNVNDDLKIYNDFKNGYVIEGLIETQPLDKSIRILKKRFNDIEVFGGEAGEIVMIDLKKGLDYYQPLVNNLGYFISRKCINDKWYNYIDKISGFISGIVIEPKFDSIVDVPPILYHATLSKNNKSISKVGLIPRSNNKKTTHPDRIYFTKDPKIADILSKDLYKNETNPDISIWEINTDGLVIRLYKDINFEYGLYTLGNIPPNNLKLMHV